METIAAIEQEIRAAFPAERRADMKIVELPLFDEERTLTASEFSDKLNWTKIDFAWLDKAPDGWATALTWMTDEAKCFYIPAYIVADLHGALQQAEPSWHLTFGFTDWTNNTGVSGKSREAKTWASLSQPQTLAIVHYLEWLVSEDTFGVEVGAAQALRRFWYRRSSCAYSAV